MLTLIIVITYAHTHYSHRYARPPILAQINTVYQYLLLLPNIYMFVTLLINIFILRLVTLLFIKAQLIIYQLR